MKVYFQERIWLYFFIWRQPDSEMQRSGIELSLASSVPLSIKSPCNLYIFCYNKHIKGNRHRVVGHCLRKNLPAPTKVQGRFFVYVALLTKRKKEKHMNYIVVMLYLLVIILVPLTICSIFIGAIWGIVFLIIDYPYKKTSYYNITHIPYTKMYRDTGRYGEYLTYKRLKYYEERGAKFLFNCYLPRDDGETTEIDVLMLHTSGIYVFESKNYSGWIFGDEKSKTWTQTLPNGRGRRAQKEHFLNPIIQNKVHIKWLKKVLNNDNILCHSVIVFSERCELKNVKVFDKNIFVINRQHIEWAVRQLDISNQNIFSVEDINRFYNILYPFTQVSENEKIQHIKNIKQRISQNTEEIKVGQIQSYPLYYDNICPWCGNRLVIRSAKGVTPSHQFWGCSSFPNCRYVKQFENQER